MIIDKEKLIFIHIPKTAGTSLAFYFDKNTEDLIPDKYGVLKHDKIKVIKTKIQNHKEYKKFTIVRNPYDRMVSWYFYLKNECLQSGLPLEKAFPCNFIQWIKDPYGSLYAKQKLNIYKNGKDINMGYLDPQYTFLDKDVVVLKYENLNNDLNNFFKKEIKLPIKNSTNHEYYLNYYNKYALEIVYDIYKEDFKRFNYKRIEKI